MSAPAAAADEPAWVGEVLRFWLEELAPAAWFKRDEALDAAIHARFRETYQMVAAAPAEALLTSPRTALAAVVALDQLPRNMFRGAAAAFATDGKARATAEGAMARGYDRVLDRHGRLFLYLPFEHSEDAGDQRRSVALFATLGDAEWSRYAQAHKVIIDRFGRFPHRNAALGRISTPEELAFLEQPGSSF